MGLSSGGTVEQKLEGSFMLFDKDHDLVRLWSGYSDTLADQYRKEINKVLD